MANAVRKTRRRGRTRLPSREGHDSQGEGRIGRHGDTPALYLAARANKVHSGVDERRYHNASESGGDRQRRLARIAHFTDQHLALDLEADDEEKERHQSIVDPMPQRLGNPELLHADGQIGLPETLVCF